MTYLYSLMNSLITFIKATFFLLANVSTSHCAPNDEAETTSAIDSISIKNQYKVSLGPTIVHSTEIYQTSPGLFLQIEKYDENGEHSSICFNFGVPAAEVVTGAAWFVYYKKLLYLMQQGGIDKKIQFQVYTGIALATGGFLLSARAIITYINSLNKTAEHLKAKNFHVVIEKNGEITNVNDLSTVFSFVGKDPASGTRKPTYDIEKNSLSDGKNPIQESISTGEKNIDNAVNNQLEEMMQQASDARSSTQSLQLSEADDGGGIISYLRKTLSNIEQQTQQSGLSVSGTPESLSASQANQLRESIDDIWESPKYDSASRAMTSLDHYYGFSPVETKEFEYLFDSIMVSWSLMFILNLSLALWLFFTFFFPELKEKKESFIEKYPFLKKSVLYYNSLDKEKLLIIRRIIFMLWLGCNVVMVGSLAGLWYCFKLTIKHFFIK